MSTSVPSPVEATFRLLATVETSQVTALLAAALEVPREPIQFLAARTLLWRESEYEHWLVIQHLLHLPSSVTELVRQRAKVLLPAFKQALLHGTSDTRRQALAAIRRADLLEPIPYVLELLHQGDLPEAEFVVETLRDVVGRLADRWHLDRQNSAPANGSSSLSTSSSSGLLAAREQLLKHLVDSVEHFRERGLPEDLAEALLVLGDPTHPAVRRILWHGPQAARNVLYQQMQQSCHPGVLQFLMDSLRERYPHPQVFVAVKQRRDVEFISALLRLLEPGLAGYVADNLHQIDRVAWITLPLEKLETIPTVLQPALVTFIEATQIPREQKAAVLEWLLRYGQVPAKLAAVERLSLMDERTARDVIRENLSAADASIQAWATSQLRHASIPDAYALLVQRLDSPWPEVSEAARRELAAFNTETVLSLIDQWNAEQAQRAGQLLLRTDPEVLEKLRRELWHPSSHRRGRILHHIVRLGLQERLAEAIVTLVHDPDASVRQTLAEVLEHVQDSIAKVALNVLMDDTHPRVRKTAATVLLRRGLIVSSSAE